MRLPRPAYLSPKQVPDLEMLTKDKPVISKTVTIGAGGFSEKFNVRENDVFLVKLKKIT
ncbi:hypothetical protein [Hymenobacter sp. BT491]|uniref:hypothetical protein n=1 Tax=Hymenobacter sp. BT491 TaxID=2766779 RepID=UPI001653D856|nr:hypothetical protein [Hymenobacter sp. BT491]MBC6992397.1 hypothetical protein [Hymenobacter sp. BT491]